MDQIIIIGVVTRQIKSTRPDLARLVAAQSPKPQSEAKD
jgi:hypothetical protein